MRGPPCPLAPLLADEGGDKARVALAEEGQEGSALEHEFPNHKHSWHQSGTSSPQKNQFSASLFGFGPGQKGPPHLHAGAGLWPRVCGLVSGSSCGPGAHPGGSSSSSARGGGRLERGRGERRIQRLERERKRKNR